jgi:integrase
MIDRLNYLRVSQHLKHLEEEGQIKPSSLERYRFYLRHLLLWAGEQSFKNAKAARPTLPAYLASRPGKGGKGNLAAATQKKILDSSQRFFRWAKSDYPHEFGSVPLGWIESLRLPRRPQAVSENIFVSIEEARQLIGFSADSQDLALLRDQAAAALLFLSGMRAGAFATLPISALDLETLTVRQWPELGVHTKNSKKATTFLLNIPGLLEPIRRWDSIVRPAQPPTSPWYAPIAHNWGEQNLSSEDPGKNRSQALVKRFKLLFGLAQVAYKSPHKFRHGHAVFGLMHAQTMADYKAVSMNLMHDSIEITDRIYAPMLPSDVQARIAGLLGTGAPTPEPELEAYLNRLDRGSQKHALVFIAGRLAE